MLEQDLAFQKQTQVADPNLAFLRNNKTFYHKLHQYAARALHKTIQIVALHDLRVVDMVATSHDSEIRCLDVASVSKNIVSYSESLKKN